MRAYVRPLGEPNRCLNVYASYDCEGGLRDSAHTPFWYRRAFRRIYILLHGGGKRAKIDARLADAGLPPLSRDVAGLPRAPVAVIWSTLPAGSPTVPQNRPRHFYPGDGYVDWVGTDFYSDNQDWKSLTGLYNRFSSKPFAIPEFGVSSGDDPRYVQHLMTWVKRHDALQDARLLPGLRLLEPLPDPELPGEPRRARPADPLEALPRLRPRPPHRHRPCPPAASRRGNKAPRPPLQRGRANISRKPSRPRFRVRARLSWFSSALCYSAPPWPCASTALPTLATYLNGSRALMLE